MVAVSISMAIARNFFQVFFKLPVVLPNAAVGGITGACPVVAPEITDRCRDSLLQRESR